MQITSTTHSSSQAVLCGTSKTTWHESQCMYQNRSLLFLHLGEFYILCNRKQQCYANSYQDWIIVNECVSNSQQSHLRHNKNIIEMPKFIHSFITKIYIAPLQGYYSEVLPTLARLKRRVLKNCF